MGRAVVEEMKDEALHSDELDKLRDFGDIYGNAYVVAVLDAHSSDENTYGN